MGSKAKIAKEILPIILSNRLESQYYIEPFCGGCNSLCHVNGNRIGNDKNNYLIAMWKSLTETELEFPNHISRENYNFYRDIFNKRNSEEISSDDAMIGWVGFMSSFNGRFFDGGYSGHFSGKRDYISEQIRNTRRQVDALKGVEWQCGDYFNMNIPNNSIIYCDIPYKNTKQYLVSKNFNYEQFYKWCITVKEMGHTIYVSEYSMPSPFTCVWEKEVTNSMNQIITKKPIEKLFTLN